MLFNLLQAAVDTTAIAQAAPLQQEMKLSLIDMAVKGGWLMIVLLLLSILAIYIFVIKKVDCSSQGMPYYQEGGQRVYIDKKPNGGFAERIVE